MQKLGYIRVSTQDQRPDRQVDGLETLCDRLFIEKVSAAQKRRPVFDRVLADLKDGDTLLIWDLDRAFRSVIDALQTLDALKARGIALHIVNMNLDTTTPGGLLVYTVLSAFAEFERRIISHRTKEGIAAARNRGSRLGRPPKLSAEHLAIARRRIQQDKHRIKDVAREFGVAPWSLTRALRRE